MGRLGKPKPVEIAEADILAVAVVVAVPVANANAVERESERVFKSDSLSRIMLALTELELGGVYMSKYC